MSKKQRNKETEEMNVGVNTPERTDEMDEREFYDEDQAQANDEVNDGDAGYDNQDTPEEAEDKNNGENIEAPKGFVGFVKRHWKVLLAVGAVTVVGGVIFVYFMGKTYKVDAKKLTDVLPFPAKDNTDLIEEKTTEELMELAKKAAEQAEERSA